MPSDTLAQTSSVRRKVEASLQDDLAAVAGNSSGPPNMNVPPPFAPLGSKAGVGAVVKSTSTVLTRMETQMETDEQISSTSIGQPHVPPPTPAKPKYYIAPSLADEAGMRKRSNNILSGHPGGCATFSNSGAIHMSPSSRLLSTR